MVSRGFITSRARCDAFGTALLCSSSYGSRLARDPSPVAFQSSTMSLTAALLNELSPTSCGILRRRLRPLDQRFRSSWSRSRLSLRRGGEDGWRVFHVITDARNRYLTAGTCDSGAETCSARIIESAKRQCASVSGRKQSSAADKTDARDAVDASLIKVYAEAIDGMAGARPKPSNGPNCEPYVVDARTVATRGGLVPSQGGAYFVLMGSDKTLEYAGTCGGTPFECAQQVGRRMDEFCPGAP